MTRDTRSEKDQLQLQNEIERLQRSVQSLTGEVLTVYEELFLLYQLGRQLGPLTDKAQIGAVALREAIETLSADCGWIVLTDGTTLEVPDGCRAGICDGTIDDIHRAFLEPLRKSNKSEFLSHAFNEELKLGNPDAPTRFLASSLTVAGDSKGYMCLGRSADANIFLSADQKLVNTIAFITAMEMDNLRLRQSELDKQRMVNELELARTIQRSLLPQDFSFAGFIKATGISQPCNEIGGDYFDMIPIDSGAVLLVIADVTGKGTSAALQAGLVQGIIHGVSQSCWEPPALVTVLNECILRRTVEGKNVTAFVATLDSNGRLKYTNGGHNPPLWIRTNGEVVELSDGGLLLGFLKGAQYAEGSIQLLPGDLLLLYTDGITDAEDSEGNSLGTDSLLEWAHLQAGRPPLDVQEDLVKKINQFSANCRQADDLTVLVVQYCG